jgi:hypothetical protein
MGRETLGAEARRRVRALGFSRRGILSRHRAVSRTCTAQSR